MNVLIGDFLSVSKFELGTFKPKLIKVDISEVTDSLIEENAHLANKKNIEIKKKFALNTAVVDLHLIRMIIGNLLSNAIKYSDKNSTVHVSVDRIEEGIAIIVKDSGMGIPSDEQEMLFTKLFRAQNAKKDVPEGTGLGLYIVKSAVETLGGKITFTSDTEKGTMFRVELPT